jgi:hypothetical protein
MSSNHRLAKTAQHSRLTPTGGRLVDPVGQLVDVVNWTWSFKPDGRGMRHVLTVEETSRRPTCQPQVQAVLCAFRVPSALAVFRGGRRETWRFDGTALVNVCGFDEQLMRA